MATTAVKTLRFEVIAGPSSEPLLFSSAKPQVVGRSGGADARLLDETVSRRHCEVSFRADSWLLADLSSRHGTSLNGVPLRPNSPAPIRDGDLVGIGPWTFIVRSTNRPTTSSFLTTSDDGGAESRVQKVPQAELSVRAQHRLDLLVESAATIASAQSEQALSEALLSAAIAGTGFARASFLRHVGSSDEVELISTKGAGVARGAMDFSRSLLKAAAEGQVVRMESSSAPNFGQSILHLGIHSALCAPLMINGTPAAYIYLDARHSESAVHTDAAAFCQALARMGGMALSNIKRAEIERRQHELEGDLRAAHEAQMKLMPPPSAQVGEVIYAMRSIPGRMVAGDLFDVFELPGGRVAVFLGDVAGKGVSAALLMATAQAHLNALLRQHRDPGVALTEVNRHIAAHCSHGRFISLWAAVIDPAREEAQVVDAGHGHWLVRPVGQRPAEVRLTGGLLLGIDHATTYVSETLPLPRGSRLIVYSDGVVEQQSPNGDMFGVARAIEALAPCVRTDEDVDRLVQAVVDFAYPSAGAGSRPPADIQLADDMTVASIQV